MRHSEDEPAAVVLDRLMAKRPTWQPHPKDAWLSVSHETRDSYEQRLAAWETAVERERQRAKEGR